MKKRSDVFYPYKKRKQAYINLIDDLSRQFDTEIQKRMLIRFISEEIVDCTLCDVDYQTTEFYNKAMLLLNDLKEKIKMDENWSIERNLKN